MRKDSITIRVDPRTRVHLQNVADYLEIGLSEFVRQALRTEFDDNQYYWNISAKYGPGRVMLPIDYIQVGSSVPLSDIRSDANYVYVSDEIVAVRIRV